MNIFRCVWLILFLACPLLCHAQEPAAPPAGIPEATIAALQKDLAEAGTATTSAGKRRAYKNIVRDGEALLEGAPAALNRWQVLGIMLDGRKRLFGMENTAPNRGRPIALGKRPLAQGCGYQRASPRASGVGHALPRHAS
jgi:hypothetical protein